MKKEISNLQFDVVEIKNQQLLLEGTTSKLDTEDYIIEADFSKVKSDIDKYDYLCAAASGLLTAALNILWVKEFDLLDAQNWGRDKVDSFVLAIAQKEGYKNDSISGAIKHLEDKFSFIGDLATDELGGGKTHHLKDFTHHPTIIGLVFSILSEFTGYYFGTDKDGNFIYNKIKEYEPSKHTIKEKLANGTIKWIFHLISDMAGSSESRDNNSYGTGIPGPFLATLKELSTLPIIKDITIKYKNDEISLSVFISKLFNGTAFDYSTLDDVKKLDLRTELGVGKYLVKQTIPVILNNTIVCIFYTIRRFIFEIRENEISTISDLKALDYKRILPYKNRSLIRMLDVANGTFMTVVSANAIVKSAIISKGDSAKFAKNVLINLNYPGLVSFTISFKADAKYMVEDVKQLCFDFIENYRIKSKNRKNDELLSYSVEELNLRNKLENKYRAIISGRKNKIIIGTATTAAATALTGGLALTFAPQIAVMLAGESVAALSGAALTNASLAIIGGGSLAAGGLGIAGGTAIIASGGAAIGLASGSAISTLSQRDKKDILNQCVNILVNCKYSIEKENKKNEVTIIRDKIEKEYNILLEEIKINEQSDDKEIKKQIKEIGSRLKYYKRTIDELNKML